jgi:small-conductance mechanosensitive channel
MEQLINQLNLTDSPIIKGLLMLVVFVIAAKATDVFISKFLKRLAVRTKSTIDNQIIDIVHKPVFYSIILVGAVESIYLMKPPEKVMFYANGVMFSLIVIVLGSSMIRVSNLWIENAFHKIADITGLGKDVIPFMETVWKLIIVAAGLMFILSIWNINITPVLASAGIVGVAVALAAKDTLANFFGGVSIFFDRPYKVGDYIVLDTGERGEVVEIGIRSTRIRTRDDIMISVPNSIIANTKVINESAPVPKFRIRVAAAVAYGSDIVLVEKALLEIAQANDNVLEEPSPRVRFRTFGDSSLNFELLCWAKEPALRGLTIHELNSAVYTMFMKKGIVIPFPQRDVHLYRDK